MPDVAEVASIGGMVRQYQVVLDPDRLRAFGITHAMVREALEKANAATGGAGEHGRVIAVRKYIETVVLPKN